jgi:hypothetical protein
MPRLAIAACALWTAALVSGFALVHVDMAAPGKSLPAPAAWPIDASLTLDAATPTILIFAHPKCPCTRATVRQLASLSPDLRASVTLVLSGPALRTYENQPLATLAHELLGASIALDPSGVDARRFGAQTSGHVVAYSPSGQLLFSGGITPGRGHEGPTDALAALAFALREGGACDDPSIVYGCPIFSTDHQCATRDASASCCAAP